MSDITCFVVGMLQTNCYVVSAENSPECVIIDAGGGYNEIKKFLTEKGKKPVACLCTHGHFDHVKDAKKWQDEGVPICLHKADEKLFTEEEETLPGMKVGYPKTKPDRYIEDGETLRYGGMTFSVIHTPGHTQGSVCYRLDDECIFTGDTIFFHSFGRTDLGGGDFGKLVESINKVLHLEGDALLYPGHDETTTLKEERIFNPLFSK